MDVTGTIVSVSDLNVKVLLNNPESVIVGDILQTNYRNVISRFEVVEVTGNIAKTIPFDSVIFLKKGVPIYNTKSKLSIEYSRNILGRVFDSYGNLIDNTTIENPTLKDVYERKISFEEVDVDSDILWTGIKVIDFFAPIQKGSKLGLLGGAGVGKTVVIKDTDITSASQIGGTLTYELATQTHSPLRSVMSAQDTNEKVNVGSVDLGSLTWTLQSGSGYWYWQADYIGGQYYVNYNTVSQGLHAKYSMTFVNDIGFDDNELAFSDALIVVRTTSTSEYPSGILQYKLATPTDQTPAFTLPENIEIQKGGTIEIVYDDGYETPCDIDFEVAVSKVLEE